MFEQLTERLSKTLRSLKGEAKLSAENIRETLEEVRSALLEADCAVEAVQSFVEKLKNETIGLEVKQGLTPAQAFVKIVNTRLVALMGAPHAGISFATKPPAVILMAGLQGAGKTTSVAKLAKLLKEKERKSVMVVSCDVYRHGAMEQLEVEAGKAGVAYCAADLKASPLEIARAALEQAKRSFAEVLIVDTAGRMHLNVQMMEEIKALHHCLNPIETLFVVDGMTGQDAARTAQAFNAVLPLTGVIVTKLDGDARGGAILSIRHVTHGTPIKFIGMGEGVEALEPFHPERMASRILGMGDMLSLIEQLEQKLDKKEADRMAEKFKKGSRFDFEDFRQQLMQMQRMGGVSSILDKMPGMAALPQGAKEKVNDSSMGRMLAMINSMTKKERRRPEIILGSRKRRIVQGSGSSLPELNKMMKQFEQMQKMMKRLQQKGGLAQLMKQLPKGMFPPMG